MKTTLNINTTIRIVLFFSFICMASPNYARQTSNDRKELMDIINVYSKSVTEKDSVAFYNLFNEGTVLP